MARPRSPKNTSANADAIEPAVSMTSASLDPETIDVPGDEPPRKKLTPAQTKALGLRLFGLFNQYRADRWVAEQRWLRNQRQYLGIYDPDIEQQLSVNRSMAYPKITRLKCISVLSRLMNLMFPGNERNWELKASPWPDMSPKDVEQAVNEAMTKDQAAGVQPQTDLNYMRRAVQTLADKRAEDLSTFIDDQLEELGGDQTLDYIALERKVLASGIIYGLGLLRGPFVRTEKSTEWVLTNGQPTPRQKETFKPQFEHLSVWDFYPDMGAKTMSGMDGYFVRSVMSRSQFKALAKRDDFFGDVINNYLRGEGANGNYLPQTYETELRTMGVRETVSETAKRPSGRYEVITWHGPVTGQFLSDCGLQIPTEQLSDEMQAEVWIVAGYVIKADMNPWAKLGRDVRTIHAFLFDEDDTSPIGQGLPNVVRDSQMSIAAMTRMLLDNAGVVCGPNLELNTDLLRPDQDLTSVQAYKMWYREGTGVDSQYPAVRNVQIESHMKELLEGIKLFMEFADAETFVGPATGGDMSKAPSEPMRTAAGASMLRGDAALPFKDIVRAFDTHTQSVIQSLVAFNREYNPDQAPEGDYNVIARGATSLIAKEVRSAQMDMLAQTLQPQDEVYVDRQKLLDARFKARDLGDMLLSDEDVARNQAQQAQQAQQQQDQQNQMIQANIRKLLSDAFKNISQGQKNSAAADATSVDTALQILQQHLTMSMGTGGMNGLEGSGDPAQSGAGGGGQPAPVSLPAPGDGGAGGAPAPAPAFAGP